MAMIFAVLNNYKKNQENFLDNKDWKIDVDSTNNLVFKFKDKNVAQISKHGELTSTRCKCGQWNIRDSRIGIPGRNDMNMHSWSEIFTGIPKKVFRSQLGITRNLLQGWI